MTPEEQLIAADRADLKQLQAENAELRARLAEAESKLEFVEEGLPEAMVLDEHYVWASQELTRRKAFEKADICRIIGSLKKELESVHVINTMNGEEWQADTKALRDRLADVASRRDNEQDAFAAWQRNALARQLALESQCQKMRDALGDLSNRIEHSLTGDLEPDVEQELTEIKEAIDSCVSAPLGLELLNRVSSILAAVQDSQFGGIECKDVNGQNWFDARDALLTSLSPSPNIAK